MSRKTINPGSTQSDSALVPYVTAGFSGSVIKGIPASSIPDNSLADAFNVITSPVDAYGRAGSRLWTDTPIPSLEGRTGYSASLDKGIITADSPIFTENDVGQFFVWPGMEETHDEIIEYLTSSTVRVANSDVRTLTAGCRLVGRTNLWTFHKIQKKWIFMFGSDIYIAEDDISSFIKCLVVSRDNPQNAISGYDDFDDESGIIFNSGGMFRIDFSTAIPLVYRINTPIPNRAIPEVKQLVIDTSGALEPQKIFLQNQYRYLFAGARLGSDGIIRDRLTPCKIEQESGTNIWGDDYQDYSEIWTAEPIGKSQYTYGILTCGMLAGGYEFVDAWIAIGGMASFRIMINGIGPYEVTCEFDDNLGIVNMPDVAKTIELAVQGYWPEATCEYSDGRLILTSGRIENGSIDYAVAGATGTDISALMGGTVASGGVVTNPFMAMPKIIGPIYVPNVENTSPEEYQWHLTHFPIYRTRELNNQYKIDTETDQYNDPNMYIWGKDLRICAAFYATKHDGLITALVGEFEEADRGSTLEWEDGTRDEIVEYIDPHTVRYQNDYYYYDPDITMAAEIGNGRVMRASQAGNVVTRTHGGSFTAADVRKTIHWANGYRSYILRVIDANSVEVADGFSKQVQGFTIDPVYRHYNDTTSDKTLESRKTTLVLKQRFWQAMENGNVGIKVPGLVFTAQRGSGELSYGQVPDKAEHLCGYHDKAYQITKKIPDDIQFMWRFKNGLSFWTSRKTWRWTLDSYEYLKNENTKDAILVISGIEMADEDRGLFDWGSFEPIGDGKAMMLTNEPGGIGWRSYDGFQYGPNILEIPEVGNERLPEMNDLQKATRALYDGVMGLMLWGRE